MDLLLLLLLSFLPKSGGLWTHLCCPFSSKAVLYGRSFITFAIFSLQKRWFMDLLALSFLFQSCVLWTLFYDFCCPFSSKAVVYGLSLWIFTTFVPRCSQKLYTGSHGCPSECRIILMPTVSRSFGFPFSSHLLEFRLPLSPLRRQVGVDQV